MRPELVQAAELLRRNTPEAIEEALGLLQTTVYSFSMKMCGHPEDAQDTMQDVLFRSLNHLARFPEPEALAAWLYTVTKNRCRRMRRNHGASRPTPRSLDELVPDGAELQRLMDPGSSPETEVLRAEQHQLLHQAVLQLPTSLRLVLVLHDMEELDTDQVAQILGLQPGTVRVRLHRGRLMVRKHMRALLEAHVVRQSAPKRKMPSATRSAHQQEACRNLFAQLSDYLDGRMAPATCEELTAHIERCPECVAFLRDLRAAIDRCKSINSECDPAVAARMRALFTREYMRLLNDDAHATR